MLLEALAISCVAYLSLCELCRCYAGEIADAYWIPRRGALILTSHALVGLYGARGDDAALPPVNLQKQTRRWAFADLARDRAAAVGDGAVCAICLDALADAGTAAKGDDAAAAPLCEIRRCGHVFCAPCIARWLAENRTCPLCAQDVTALSAADATAPGPEEARRDARPDWIMLHQC